MKVGKGFEKTLRAVELDNEPLLDLDIQRMLNHNHSSGTKTPSGQAMMKVSIHTDPRTAAIVRRNVCEVLHIEVWTR